jgi:hypothetical protein
VSAERVESSEPSGPGRPAGEAGPAPVFVHAWFRSGSTWLWAKMRRQADLCAYYEPLNEELPLWTVELLSKPSREAFAGDAHPLLDRPRFFEYRGLIAAGRLGYEPRFAFDRYLLGPEEADPALEGYLHGLVAAARAEGRRPVLCFCRSQMRALWMRERFGGVHIAQLRNPWDQWASFGKHRYFRERLVLTAIRLFGQAPERLGHIAGLAQAAANLARGEPFQIEAGQVFRIFATVWLASSIQAVAASDIVLDVDRVGGDAACRSEVARRLREAGLALDLSDCRPPSGSPRTPDQARQLDAAVEALAGAARGLIPFADEALAARVRRFLSAESAALVGRVLR